VQLTVNEATGGVLPGEPPQVENLKFAIRVFQLKLPFAGRYSVVYHKVQSSTGSTLIEL